MNLAELLQLLSPRTKIVINTNPLLSDHVIYNVLLCLMILWTAAFLIHVGTRQLPMYIEKSIITLAKKLPTSVLCSTQILREMQEPSGAVVYWLLLLDNFIQQSLNSGSAQTQILLAACWKFAMVRIFDNGPGWK